MNAICPLSGKVRYGSRREAQQAHALWRKREPHAKRPLPKHTYRCTACGDWHLTKAAPRPARPRP